LTGLQERVHNAQCVVDKEKPAALLSLANATVVLSWDFPVWGWLFGFSVITVNRRLIVSNDILQKIFVICSLEEIFIAVYHYQCWAQILLRPETFQNHR
jgi:hypothetical protein